MTDESLLDENKRLRRALELISESEIDWEDVPDEPDGGSGKRIWCWYAELVLAGFDIDKSRVARAHQP